MNKGIKKICLGVLIVVMLSCIFIGCGVSAEQQEYEKAIAFMEEKNFEEALPIFVDLGDYEDSTERVKECKYNIAIALIGDGNYKDGLILLSELGSYKDALQLLQQIEASILLEQNYDALKSYLLTNPLSIEQEVNTLRTNTYSIEYDKDKECITFQYASVGNSLDTLNINLFKGDNTVVLKWYTWAGFSIGEYVPTLSASYTALVSELREDSNLTRLSYEIENDTDYDNEFLFGTQDKLEKKIVDLAYVLLVECNEMLRSTRLDITLSDLGFTSIGD